MATCSKCGSELKEGLKFCLKCGQPVGQSILPQSPTAAPRPMRPQPLKAVQPGQPQKPVQFQQSIAPTARPMWPKPMTASIELNFNLSENLQNSSDKGRSVKADSPAVAYMLLTPRLGELAYTLCA